MNIKDFHEDAEIINAIIRDVNILKEGVSTMSISLEHERGHQTFGGYALDKPIMDHTGFLRREGVAWGMEFILRVMDVVGASSLKDMLGKPCRIIQTWDNIYAIGHFLEKDWFVPSQDINHLKEEHRK